MTERDTQPQKDDTYECSVCHGVFGYEWSDKEADAERQDDFPDVPKDQCAILCDDCYNGVKASMDDIFKEYGPGGHAVG